MNDLNKIEVTAFDASRLTALNQYAMLEVQLAHLLQTLLDTSISKANTIFYRVTNTRSRYAIIDSLISLTDDASARKFWSKIEKDLNPIDQFRNNLVHWVPVVDLGNSSEVLKNTPHQSLQPGHSIYKQDAARLTAVDIQKRLPDINRMTLLVSVFRWYFGETFPEPQRSAWREIFLQPITDQTAEALAQSLTPKEP